MIRLKTAFVGALCLGFGTSQATEPAEEAGPTTVQVERATPTDAPSLEEDIDFWLEDGFDPSTEEEPVTKQVVPGEEPPEGVMDLGRVHNVRELSGEGLWHLDTLIGTDFPIDIGGRLILETPSRVRFLLGLGGMPESFQRAANDVIVAVGGYDAEMAAIVDDTLRAAFVLHTGIGLRPAKNKGFVIDVGYRMIMVTAQNTPSSVLAQVSNVVVPASVQDFAGDQLRLRSYLHQATVRAGWEWLAADRLSIRFDIGGSFTFDTSHSLISHGEEEVPQSATEYITEAESQLDVIFRKYGHTPTVGLSFGYRWF